MEYEKKHYRRNTSGVVRYSPASEDGEAANLQQRTALGKHRDGSIYLRTADAEDMGKVKSAADSLGVSYRQRRAGASHFGRAGSYEHLHFDTPVDALNVHAALAYHLEKDGDPQGHDEHLAKLAAGLHGHIQGKDARVDGCMVNTRHAHEMSLAAGKEDTPQAHKSAADLHRLSAEAHRAQAARPWTKGEGAHHAGMAILHDAIAAQHDKKAVAAHKRIQAELKRQAEMKARMEAAEEGRETKKSVVHAHTRTMNGKLVQVHEYQDKREHHDSPTPEHQRQKIGTGSTGDVFKHGDKAVKTATNNEAKVYAAMRGIDGVSAGESHGNEIHTPFYKHIISTDEIPSAHRSSMASLIKPNIQRINSAVTALSEAGFSYNDPFQFGLNQNKTMDLFDFSAAEHSPATAEMDNLALLAGFYSTFGLQRVADGINLTSEILSTQKLGADERLMDDDEASMYRKLDENLDGETAKYAYFATNGRHVGINKIAQTEPINGIKVILTTRPLSQGEIDNWELTPVVHPCEQREVKKGHVEGESYVMPLDEAIAEHEELVHTLETPSREDDAEEVKDQGGELAEMKEARKAIVHEHTRTVNGKLVTVREHDDSRHGATEKLSDADLSKMLDIANPKIWRDKDGKEECKCFRCGKPIRTVAEVGVNGGGVQRLGLDCLLTLKGKKTGKKITASAQRQEIEEYLTKAYVQSMKDANVDVSLVSKDGAYAFSVDGKTLPGNSNVSYGIASAVGYALQKFREAAWERTKQEYTDLTGAKVIQRPNAPNPTVTKFSVDGVPIDASVLYRGTQKCLGTVGAGTDLSTLEGGGALRAEGHDEEMDDATMGREAKKGLDLDPLPEPTPGQAEAGNYKVHKVNVQGLEISIENPKGSIRRGVDGDGHEWESKMVHDYGYFRGAHSDGPDGDPVDVFVGPDLNSPYVHVVNQVNPKTGKFDEFKVMLGFKTREDAVEGYLANYEKGWKGLGDMKTMHILDFKQWLKHGDLKHRLIYKAATVRLDNAARLQMQVLRCHPANRLSPDFLNTIHAAKSAGISTQEILRTISNATGAFAPLLNHLRENQ